MNKDLMSEEAFNELIDGLEYVERLTEYGRRNIKYYVQKLQQENKILKENAEHNDKVVDKVNWENMLLKKENKQLKNNWNYIKKMLKGARQEEFNINGYCGTCTDVDIDFLLNKMQELEGSDSNE